MMSHEEHRRQPTGEEEDGEDEEQDIEARTAVEALLALTSPTEYTHHSGYEEDYIMEPVGEGYSKTASGEKDGMEAFNSTPDGEEEEEEEEMDVDEEDDDDDEEEEEDDDEEEEGEVVRAVQQPQNVTLGKPDVREVRQAQVTNEGGVRVSEAGNRVTGGTGVREGEGGAVESTSGDVKDMSQSDEGLTQLRAFIQAMEGRQEGVTSKSASDGGSSEQRSVFTENRTALKTQSEGQHQHSTLGKNVRGMVMLPNQSLKDAIAGGVSGVSSAMKVGGGVTGKLSPPNKFKDNHNNQNAKREGVKSVSQGNATSSTGDLRYGELQKTSSSGSGGVGGIKYLGGNEAKTQKEEEEEDEDEEEGSSEESENEREQRQEVREGEGEKQGERERGKEGSSDTSDSEGEENEEEDREEGEEDGDSDSSSSSSGSSSSSSNDSDSDGSESDSESENEAKCVEGKPKEPNTVATENSVVKSVSSAIGGEKSEKKDSEVTVKPRNIDDMKLIDKTKLPDSPRVIQKARLTEPLKIPNVMSLGDPQKHADKTKGSEQLKNIKTILPCKEETEMETKPLTHNMKDTKPLTQTTREVKPLIQITQNTEAKVLTQNARETKLLIPKTEKGVPSVEGRRRSCEGSEEGLTSLSVGVCKDTDTKDSPGKMSSNPDRKNSGNRDMRKDASDMERKLSIDAKNCLTAKVVDAATKAEKPLSISSSGGVKIPSDREKLFNNNSISITKSQVSVNANNNNNNNNGNSKNKKNSVIKSGVQASKVLVGPPKLIPKISGPSGGTSQRSQVDLVQEVAAAFAQQLSSIQANQERNGAKTQNTDSETLKPDKDSTNHSPRNPAKEEDEEEEDEDEEKGDSEIEDMFPIQAEVVMSEGSESGLEYETFEEQPQQSRQAPQGDLSWCQKGSEVLDPSEKENLELMAYLKSYVNGTSEGELVEYPPPNNDLPPGGQDLTQWQLDGVRLPPFTPSVAPPSWLRLTIPAEGYRCQSCDDTFFIESSLVQHRERRSVWISLECGPCDAKLTFYNRCALKDHLRNHMAQGEEVDEETVEVRSLPLQLTRLLQPIVVPVPDSLRMGGKKVSRNLKSHGAVNKLPVLKPIGRCAATSRLTDYQNDGGDGASVEDDQDDTGDQEEGFRSPSDSKIPPGIKRLSPRKRTVRCYLCERMFHSVRELMAHMRTDQPYSDQRVECKKCQLVLPSVCAAKAHILTHPPANTSNISVCPECGSRCDGPREFVHHLNTCGHQYRRSGVVCTECQVCFFRSQDDFLTHWIAEHCAKSYECVVCHSTFESLVFHRCSSPGQQVLATFRCLLTCPLCSVAVQLHAQEEQDTNGKIRAHLAEAHPTIITRVHYVYKSKFCTNAFRSKDELRAHHDREHRRDNHYRTKTCTLHHEVLGYQHQYFSGQEPRNAFVTLPVALSAEELHEARIRDVPTVSSVIDKTLFPDLLFQEGSRGIKSDRSSKNKAASKGSPKEGEAKDGAAAKETPVKKDMDQLDKLRPKVCYRCGFYYADNKDFRRHKRTCEGEAAERQCQLCGLTAVGEDFARHCLGHVQEGAILCIYCNGTQYSTMADLEQHFELHVHEQFSYPASCAFCCTSLPDVPTALAHINEEHDPLHIPFDTSEFECDKCGRRFHGERGLSVHIGRCTLGTATPTPASAGCRQCQVCTKALTPEMFGRHMVCHLEEGLLVCSLCDGRTLPSSMALLHHLEEHAAALAYPSSCPMCAYSMQDSTSALTHLKEEHGFGNLHCADCDMHFNFTYQLQRHTDIVHKICQYAKRRYICWICRAYDHVKKETLMNHFRTVHGLDRQQVDEKVMIRTRGQGTMPTSQFIPTKPLGSKENQALAQANKDAEATPAKTQRDNKSKTSPSKSSSTGTDSPIKQSSGMRSPTGRQAKDSPLKTLTPSESPIKEESSKINTSQTFSAMDGPPQLYAMEGSLAGDSSNSFTPGKLPRSMVAGDRGKVKDKMKVLVKRLPNSILDEESRSKRRRTESQRSETEQENKEGMAKEERIKKKKKKKKKKKAYKCPVCLFGTNFKDKMDSHILKHKENGEEVVCEADGFVCRECGASFVVEPSLARHMFFAHKIKLHVSSGDENKDTGATEVENEPSDDVKVEEKEEVCIKEVKKEEKAIEEKEGRKTVPKRKVLRETVRKKTESEPVTTRSELRSRRGEAPALRRKPAKTNPKRRPERTSSSSVTVTSKRREDTSRRKVAKEGSRKTLERQSVAIKREIEEEGEEAKLDNQCVVCKEEFTNAVELYSHLRTHGMAFLKLGRKARPLGLGKPPALDR